MFPLLASWSPVFEKMMNSEDVPEHRTAQLVITDFSSTTVEVFLRFLYSGVVEGPLETVVEVPERPEPAFRLRRPLPACRLAQKRAAGDQSAPTNALNSCRNSSCPVFSALLSLLLLV
ncbi:unnamed protein product [Symbiodinium microadriaticum]|nr:unnamed protein product [Symbiodinium microadriaticum]